MRMPLTAFLKSPTEFKQHKGTRIAFHSVGATARKNRVLKRMRGTTNKLWPDDLRLLRYKAQNTPAPSDVCQNTGPHYFLCANPHRPTVPFPARLTMACKVKNKSNQEKKKKKKYGCVLGVATWRAPYDVRLRHKAISGRQGKERSAQAQL